MLDDSTYQEWTNAFNPGSHYIGKWEEGYEKRGVSEKEAQSRAWATVNKSSGGGKKSGSGRGKKENKVL